MSDVANEVKDAIRRLELGDSVRFVGEPESSQLFRAMLSTFTCGKDVRWWWGLFENSRSLKFPDGKAFQRIVDVVPNAEEFCWFVIEDDQEPHYPILEATPSNIARIISECFGFEYYVVPKSLSWILCENHHDYLIGVGEPITRALTALCLDFESGGSQGTTGV